MKFPGRSSEGPRRQDSALESGGYEIVELTPDDWQELKTLRIESAQNAPRAFGDAVESMRSMTEENWRGMFTTGRYFAARENGKLVGVVCMVRERESGADHIVSVYSLYVTPEARRSGVGTALLERVLTEVQDGRTRKLRLRVDAKDDGAIALYRNMGFTDVGVLKEEMRLGDEFVDKLVMEKFLG